MDLIKMPMTTILWVDSTLKGIVWVICIFAAPHHHKLALYSIISYKDYKGIELAGVILKRKNIPRVQFHLMED